jgi:flavin reductase (DIM6/NTAB) family NADH-FMN oxidoreductase RutF
MELNIFEQMGTAMKQVADNGAFLTVKSGNKVNTMTIGWALLGRMWSKPMMVVAVRYSRYTYELLQKSDSFSVSVPLKEEMKKELAFCGSKSGRDVDKFQACKMTAQDGKNENTSIVKECNLHYECKIVYKQTLEPELIQTDYIRKAYDNHDYHVMIYGEVLSCYE